jgi:hypothetical protein
LSFGGLTRAHRFRGPLAMYAFGALFGLGALSDFGRVKPDIIAGFLGHAAPACDVPVDCPNSALMHGPSAGLPITSASWKFVDC